MSVDKDSIPHKMKKKIFVSIKIGKPKKKKNTVKFLTQYTIFKTKKISKTTNEGRWSIEEQNKFLEGLELYGMKWKRYKNLIKSRTLDQIRAHAQKFFLKMKLCKNESLDIDFTLNSIKNLNDMINQIKNKNYIIINMFQYLNNEIETNFISAKKKPNKKYKNIYIDGNNIPNSDKNNDFINDNLIIDHNNIYDHQLSLNEEQNDSF